MPQNEIATNKSLGTIGPKHTSLERSAIEAQVRSLQADSAAHAEILLRLGGANPALPPGVVTTRAKSLFSALRARAAGTSISPVLAEPTMHDEDPTANSVGLMPRHMRRASDMQRDAATAAALLPPPPVASPLANARSAIAEPEQSALWTLHEIIPRIDFETPDLRRRIEAAQPAGASAASQRLPLLLVLPMLAGLYLCLGDLVLRW